MWASELRTHCSERLLSRLLPLGQPSLLAFLPSKCRGSPRLASPGDIQSLEWMVRKAWHLYQERRNRPARDPSTTGRKEPPMKFLSTCVLCNFQNAVKVQTLVEGRAHSACTMFLISKPNHQKHREKTKGTTRNRQGIQRFTEPSSKD